MFKTVSLPKVQGRLQSAQQGGDRAVLGEEAHILGRDDVRLTL